MTPGGPTVAPPLRAGWLLTWAPGWAALALAATAWRSPWWALLPCFAVGCGHVWLCVAHLRGPGYGSARRAVVWSALAMWTGLFSFAAGAGWIAWLAVGFGGLNGWAGVRHSLKDQPHAPVDQIVRRPTRKVLYLGSGLDLSMGAYWEFGAALRRGVDLERTRDQIGRACSRYESMGWYENPEEALETPPQLEKAKLYGRRIAGEPLEVMSFDSEFEAFDPEIAAAFAAHTRNREARAYLWRHSRGPTRPALISIHGYGMGDPRIDLRWLRVRGWDMPEVHRGLDLDVVYYVLPFHGARSSGRRSGNGYFNQHPLMTNAAMAQAIWDLRRLTGWLRAQGAPRVGVHGISLGGYVAALYASLDPDLAVAMPTIPAVDFVPLVWRQLPGFRRRQWQQAGLGPELLQRAWFLHQPLHHAPKVPPPARMIVGAFADRITTPADTLRLWEHWDHPELFWFPGTHLVWRGGDALQMRWGAHLAAHLRGSERALSRFRDGAA